MHVNSMLELNPAMQQEFSYQNPEDDQLFHADYDHMDSDKDCKSCDQERLVQRKPRPTNAPVIHYGLIGSANQVMRHGVTREKLRQERDIICFETEAAGLMDNLPCLVIRGICDYSDTHKNKKWRPYAAATAAAYAKELLGSIPPIKASLPHFSPYHNVVLRKLSYLNIGSLGQDEEEHLSYAEDPGR